MKARSTARLLLPLLSLFFTLVPIPQPALGQVDPFAGMPARSIGPAGATGRISAIDAVVADPNVVFVGAASGGVWKSENGGQSWRAVFDDQPVASIGAIAIGQADPSIVWVGIAEGSYTRDPGVPSVYRSVDGGETWTPAGLLGLEGVQRIVLHPRDLKTAYAAVSGPAWEDGGDPGVYKTVDGGRTWTRVLFVDERTGASDLVMDPSDPDRLVAAMWSNRGYPWSFESRGPGSGLFQTRDGGESWVRLNEENGVPGGDLGRIALDVSRSDPGVVYALVDAGEGVLLRSSDRGRTWRTVRRSPDLASRVDDPSDIVTDPEDPSRMFHLSSQLSVSDNGGETFRQDVAGFDRDFRVLWIHPEEPRLVYGGSDRGLYVSRDGGERWRPLGELPLGRFNHVVVDMDVPFNVYGGLDRNGLWTGPASGWADGGARDREWMELGPDDGFGILVDPDEAGRGYAVARNGELIRFNRQTGERKRIRPWAPDFAALRVNQNAPIALDPHDTQGIYYGSQFVHKSVDQGETWQIISGDLTANDPAGRRFTTDTNGSAANAEPVEGAEGAGGATITVIAPSAIDRDVIWVGTDEGDVQVTRSAGGEWESVRDRIDRVPDSSWVAHIEPSVFRPGSAYVAFDAQRTGNRDPLVFWTDNYGRDWRRIAAESDIEGVVHTLEQDPVVEALLFAGTEAGLYVSLNRGEGWTKWTHGLPPVPVHDLVLHPRDHDLVIATYGRAAYVLDDIRPLRELARNPGAVDLELLLFEPPPAFIRGTPMSERDNGLGAGVIPPREDRPHGVLLTYWLGARVGNDPEERDDDQDGAAAASEVPRIVDVEVLDFEGRVVRTFSGTAERGMNRITWDLREDPPTLSGPLAEFSDAAALASDGGVRSVDVLPGSFTVRISSEGAESLRMVEVRTDDRVDIEMVDRIAKYQAVKRALELDARLTALRAAVASVHDELLRVSDWMSDRGFARDGELVEISQTLGDELAELADFRGVMRYHAVVIGLMSSYDEPTEGQRLDLIRMEEELDEVMRRVGDFLILDINRFGDRVDAAGLDVSFFIGPIG